MHILYIAYSCMPNKGSEEKIGWNIPLQSAKNNQVCVLTKEEHRSAIEAYLQEHNIKNIKFYYADIPAVYKKIFKGIAYSMRLNIWHKRAFAVAKEICQKENIQIIHQITPIEFRSIGDYGRIPNVKFVCGPIGGGEYMPKAFYRYVGKHFPPEMIRLVLNAFTKGTMSLQRKLDRCDFLFFANRETKAYLSGIMHDTPSALYFDNGIDESEFLEPNVKPGGDGARMVFLVAGRVAYRKGHKFLLDVLARLPKELPYEVRIVGEGPELNHLKKICEEYGLESHVTFTGRIPYAAMVNEYANADVLIMPSIRETTGAVLLEAMSKGLPVVTIDRFGGPVLLNEETGWLYSGETTQEYMQHLAEIIVGCVHNPNEVRRKGRNAAQAAKQHLWTEKIRCYQQIYEAIMKEN